jgi:hypothetical protein
VALVTEIIHSFRVLSATLIAICHRYCDHIRVSTPVMLSLSILTWPTTVHYVTNIIILLDLSRVLLFVFLSLWESLTALACTRCYFLLIFTIQFLLSIMLNNTPQAVFLYHSFPDFHICLLYLFICISYFLWPHLYLHVLMFIFFYANDFGRVFKGGE